MNNKYILLFALLAILFSCKPELDEFSPSSGNADFSNYVALGNSLTAGYADGSLYRSAQLNSYPSILAKQFAKAGGGDFVQPLMEGEYGIVPGKLKLGYPVDCLGNVSLGPVPDNGPLDPIAPVGYAVDNMGVPGAKAVHLLFPGYGQLNPYFGRFASSPTASVIGDAVSQNPTFFTLWIGNNDALGYATSGGIGDTLTGQLYFEGQMNAILGNLTANGAKGAIANIPDISAIPFFNTVPSNSYVITQDQADTLNKYLGPLGFSYQAGPNYFIIEDPVAPLGFRQMVEGELLLLTVPQDSLKCAYWGGFNPEAQLPLPIPKQYVLTLDDISNLENAISGYNQTIKNLADMYNLAYVDMNSEFDKLKSGVVVDGVTLNTTFVTGNAFSLDGVHATQMGYAYAANLFINAINAKYSANIPIVSITNYPSVVLP